MAAAQSAGSGAAAMASSLLSSSSGSGSGGSSLSRRPLVLVSLGFALGSVSVLAVQWLRGALSASAVLRRELGQVTREVASVSTALQVSGALGLQRARAWAQPTTPTHPLLVRATVLSLPRRRHLRARVPARGKGIQGTREEAFRISRPRGSPGALQSWQHHLDHHHHPSPLSAVCRAFSLAKHVSVLQSAPLILHMHISPSLLPPWHVFCCLTCRRSRNILTLIHIRSSSPQPPPPQRTLQQPCTICKRP